MRAAYSVPEVAELLPISTSTLYREINRGNIESVQIGGRKLITAAWVREFLGYDPEGHVDAAVAANAETVQAGGFA